MLPDVQVRAYADDIALVLPDWKAAAPVLQGILAEYALGSGLELNAAKTV